MIIIQFALSMIATMAFAILFCAPRNEWLLCGLSGAIGWIVYYVMFHHNLGLMLSTTAATFVLSIFSRTLAVIRKQPATLYLLSGIFPLVPGAGIYYTAYYLVTGQMSLAAVKGLEAVKIAFAIVLGIIFVVSIPRDAFQIRYWRAKRKRKRLKNHGNM